MCHFKFVQSKKIGTHEITAIHSILATWYTWWKDSFKLA